MVWQLLAAPGSSKQQSTAPHRNATQSTIHTYFVITPLKHPELRSTTHICMDVARTEKNAMTTDPSQMAFRAVTHWLQSQTMPVFYCTTPAFRLRMPSELLNADPPLLQSQLSKVLSQQTQPQPPQQAIQSSQLNNDEKESHDSARRASSTNLWTKPLPQLPPPNMSLSGKVALVTGGARGIGAAIALKLAREGARVRLPIPLFSLAV